jgi:hypothetical protein
MQWQVVLLAKKKSKQNVVQKKCATSFLGWTKYKNNEKMSFCNNHVVKPGLGEAEQLYILISLPLWYLALHASIAGSNNPIDVTINKHKETNFETMGLKVND